MSIGWCFCLAGFSPREYASSVRLEDGCCMYWLLCLFCICRRSRAFAYVHGSDGVGRVWRESQAPIPCRLHSPRFLYRFGLFVLPACLPARTGTFDECRLFGRGRVWRMVDSDYTCICNSIGDGDSLGVRGMLYLDVDLDLRGIRGGASIDRFDLLLCRTVRCAVGHSGVVAHQKQRALSSRMVFFGTCGTL